MGTKYTLYKYRVNGEWLEVYVSASNRVVRGEECLVGSSLSSLLVYCGTKSYPIRMVKKVEDLP